MASDEALRIAAAARTHAPTGIDASQGFVPDTDVLVAATDYAHDAVGGRLVGLDADEVVIERSDPRAGTVHVHFPRVGYQVKKQVPA